MLEEYTYQEQQDGRVDTLVKAIDRIEVLEKQLNIALETLKEYARKDLWKGYEYTPKWDFRNACYVDGGYAEAEEAIQEISEIGNANIHGNDE